MTSRGRAQKTFVLQVAERIRHLGFRRPSLTILEAGRPLAFVAGQLVWLSQPVLALVMPRDLLSRTAELLEDPQALDSLIELLGEEKGEGAGGARWTM